MALSKTVEDSLLDAESSLRNALAYAARNEKPFVNKAIATMIQEIENIIHADQFFDTIQELTDDWWLLILSMTCMTLHF